MHFLEVQRFSEEIRFGSKDPNTMLKIQELKKNQNLAKLRIDEAKKAGKTLRMNSSISLDFI